MISISPDHPPRIGFSVDEEPLQLLDLVYEVEERSTGMILACLPGELIADDNGHYLIGTAVLYNCTEDGTLCPVTYRDFQRAKELYRRGLCGLYMGNVKASAIRVHPAGDRTT